MAKTRKIIIFIVITLILNMLTLSRLTFATDSSSVTIHFKNPNELVEKTDIGIWKLPDSVDTSDKNKLVEDLEKLSNEEISKKYSEPVYKKQLTEDKLVLENIKYGKYYVRDLNRTKNIYIASFIFEVNANSEKDIYAKNVEEPKGNYYFKKVEHGSHNPLKGAVFGVYTIKDGNYIAVKKNSQDYKIISDENGNLEVVNLAYGTYYLKEEKAPDGYKLLKNYIKFTVNKDSSNQQAILIENEKTPPIEVPETGGVMLLVLMFFGVVIFTTGYVLNKKEEN